MSTTQRVGQLGHERRHRRERVVAVGEVLVDLVGDHPDAVLDGPLADGLRPRPRGRRRRSGSTATRTPAPWCAGVRAASSWSTVTRKPVGPSVGSTTEHAAGQRDRLGVGRPVRRREQHLVAGVEQRLEGVVDGVLAAVGDEHLAGQHLVARVAERLGGDGLLQLGQAAGGRVAVVLRVAAGGDGGLDDVVGRREVGLAGAEADDRLAGRLERLGLGVDGQGGRLGDGGDAAGDRSVGGLAGHRMSAGSWADAYRPPAADRDAVSGPIRRDRRRRDSGSDDRRCPTFPSPPTCCRPTAASAAARPRSAPRRSNALADAASTLPGHQPPPGDRAVHGQPAAQRAGRAARPARRLRGPARQRRHDRVLGRRHLRADRAAQPAPQLRRVLVEVRRPPPPPRPSSTSPR